jgi:TolB-like protein
VSIWGELSRRRVFRVAGVYVVVGWLIAQAATLLESALGLPAWLDGVVVVVLLLGLPVALVLAWAFEVTPEGVRRTAATLDGAPSPKVALSDIALAGVTVALIGVSAFQIAGRGAATGAPAAGADSLSVAVLPFADMSPDRDQEYFSDGLSEELLNSLAQIPALRVAGRTSSFSFKGRNEDLRLIGEQLNVGNILEGSVRKDGNRLRITAQLVSAADGYHLWSQTYDRRLDDVFAVQEEIAAAVAKAMSVTLGVDAPALRTAPTENAEAYDLYLRARAMNRGGFTSEQQWVDAVALLERAIALDAGFAQPWAELSAAQSYLASVATTREAQTEAFDAMESAVLRAIEIAPESWESQAALMQMRMGRRQWLDADRAFRRAYAYSGESNVIMGQAYWNYMLQIGRPEESLSVIEAMLRIDPLAVNGDDAPANIDYLLGRRDAPSSSNTAPTTLLQLDALLATASDDAITRFMQGPAPAGLDLEPLGAVWAVAPGARPQAIRDYVAEHTILNRTTLATLVLLAGRLGEDELAVELMRNAFIDLDGFSGYWFIWARSLREARRTEAFKDFLRDLGLVELWHATGEWGDFCRPIGDDDFACV